MRPGTELLNLASSLGLAHSRESTKLARWMDRIGTAGCKQHFDHISGKIKDRGAEWGWAGRIADPAGMVTQAIAQAENGKVAPTTPTWTTWVDPLAVFDRTLQPTTALRDFLGSRSVFLAGGGPSANDLPLEQLERRGAWTMTINNMGGHARFRPQAFVCTDPPEKFADSIWLDPQIMKFLPDAKLGARRGKLRTKLPDGSFAPLKRDGQHVSTGDCPNVWAVKRRKWMRCDDTFFTDECAPNGNYSEGVAQTGEQKTICTMLFAMRILRHLGARRVFLIGVDFKMDSTRAPDQNYSFGELRDAGACESNNNQYRIVNDWLMRLQAAGVFAKYGFDLYNCFQHSGLRAFPFVPFEKAVELVCEGVQQTPDLKNWYIKTPKKRR